MKNNFFRIIFCFTCLFGVEVFAQTVDQIYEEVNAKFQSTFGPRYEMSAFMAVDSNIGKPMDLFGRYNIVDPYKTLAHCVVFAGEAAILEGESASPGFVGIYRGGSFIWRSDTVINDYLISFPGVLTTQDLNSDGKVDIIMDWRGGNQGIQYLWIVSWDGQTGTFINDFEPEYERGYESSVVGFSDSFEFVDIDGDGIKEIIGRWYIDDPSNRQRIVYRWNGSTYGKHGSVDMPPPGSITIPHNKLSATIKASVMKTGSGYNYHYIVSNNAISSQEIEGIFVESKTSSVQNGKAPTRWDFLGNKNSLVVWKLGPIRKETILPGNSDSNFAFNTASLPSIAASYIRGRVTTLLPKPLSADEYYQDVRNSSFIAATVGPVDPPSPFVSLNFTDTLISYTRQSRTLGWIDNDGIANSLIQKLESAKQHLQKGNANPAKNVIQAFVNEVEAQKEKHLTSEAYALLKYNAEYLVEKLGGK